MEINNVRILKKEVLRMTKVKLEFVFPLIQFMISSWSITESSMKTMRTK